MDLDLRVSEVLGARFGGGGAEKDTVKQLQQKSPSEELLVPEPVQSLVIHRTLCSSQNILCVRSSRFLSSKCFSLFFCFSEAPSQHLSQTKVWT